MVAFARALAMPLFVVAAIPVVTASAQDTSFADAHISPGVPGVAASSIAGVWWTPKHDGKVEIVVDATATASGRIIALSPAQAGKHDVRNPDGALRDRPALGLSVLHEFRQERDGTWSGGTVYDPEHGNTYRGTMSLEGGDRLKMRGYVGIALFGRTVTLTRVAGTTPDRPQPGEPDLVYLSR